MQKKSSKSRRSRIWMALSFVLFAAIGYSTTVAADQSCVGVTTCTPPVGGYSVCTTTELCHEVPAGSH